MGSKSRRFVVYYGRNTYYKHFCHCTKMKFSIKDFCSKRDQIRDLVTFTEKILSVILAFSVGGLVDIFDVPDRDKDVF